MLQYDNMIQQQRQSQDYEQINLLQPNHYGCLAKIFCCKCIHCCKDFDFSLMTSQNRKQSFQNLIMKYIKKLHENKNLGVIMDPFFILVALFLGQDSEVYTQLMNIINNQSQYAVFSKEDLQFYIPQLCTYLVFHQQLKNIELQKLLVKACKVDIHFALKYYFYMTSLQVLHIGDFEIRKYQKVGKYNLQFKNMINHYYENHRQQHQTLSLISANLNKKQQPSLYEENQNQQHEQLRNSSFFEKQKEQEDDIRGTFPNISKSHVIQRKYVEIQHQLEEKGQLPHDKKNSLSVTKQKIIRNKIRFLRQTNIYQAFICKKIEISNGIFESTLNFFSDLVELSRLLLVSQNRNAQLKKYLNLINERLPATIYIPFTKDYYQDLNIISINCDDAKVFNTKQRAPYYICLQSFQNPTYNDGISKDKKIKSFSSQKKNKSKKQFPEERTSQIKIQQIKQIHQSQIHFKLQKQKNDQLRLSNNSQKSENSKKSFKINWNSFFKLSKKIKKKIFQIDQQDGKDSSSEGQTQNKTQISKNQGKQNKFVEKVKQIQEVFGISQSQQYEKMILVSPYTNLPGYKLIHIIVKSNDDLRQESFAMQLLQQFEKIFKIQKLPVIVIPYEVLPLSHDAGIMECIKGAATIDELLKKEISLVDILDSKLKKKNFVYSLAGYSLITYFLQVKDRHNGNIMIRRDGCIFHIDYGFFMSNAPGKGVQIQKNLPFKLTNQYVQALGGLKSKYFQLFRKIFYQGFNACRKHQHRILILTKLMYTSFGKTMPCFFKGDQALQNLQERFNPLGMKSDADISVFCQTLINSSIDNWRSRWYDKWQYYVQGIFY